MKGVYPIILHREDDGSYFVDIPALEISTQGNDLADAIFMARDAIGLWGITEEDLGKQFPLEPEMPKCSPGEVITLVDVDFSDYRRRNDMRTVKKNCTIPSWLCYAAEKENINFSQVLQDALKSKLGI